MFEMEISSLFKMELVLKFWCIAGFICMLIQVLIQIYSFTKLYFVMLVCYDKYQQICYDKYCINSVSLFEFALEIDIEYRLILWLLRFPETLVLQRYPIQLIIQWFNF
jgi:hypothetical protein